MKLPSLQTITWTTVAAAVISAAVLAAAELGDQQETAVDVEDALCASLPGWPCEPSAAQPPRKGDAPR